MLLNTDGETRIIPAVAVSSLSDPNLDPNPNPNPDPNPDLEPDLDP